MEIKHIDSIQSGNPSLDRKQGNSKRYTHGFPWEEKVAKISLVTWLWGRTGEVGMGVGRVGEEQGGESEGLGG